MVWNNSSSARFYGGITKYQYFGINKRNRLQYMVYLRVNCRREWYDTWVPLKFRWGQMFRFREFWWSFSGLDQSRPILFPPVAPFSLVLPIVLLLWDFMGLTETKRTFLSFLIYLLYSSFLWSQCSHPFDRRDQYLSWDRLSPIISYKQTNMSYFIYAIPDMDFGICESVLITLLPVHLFIGFRFFLSGIYPLVSVCHLSFSREPRRYPICAHWTRYVR
jgi:hypothetical protein